MNYLFGFYLSNSMTSCRRHDGSLRGTLLLVLVLLVEWTDGIEWLAISRDKREYFNKTNDCTRKRTPGLLKDQRLICQRNTDLMPAVVQASRDTLDVCHELFADKRWNCSSIQLAPKYLPDLLGGSREQAFVYALSSAALAHSVAKACSAGLSAKCHCAPTPSESPPGKHKWGGCGDDIRFGLVFSKWFTDTASNRKKASKRSIMNLHNSAVGRKIVSESLSTQCKCHGVSGSCSIKTCFKALPDMRTIGMTLQKQYTLAIEVDGLTASKNKMANIQDAPAKNVEDKDLIFYAISPDYCLPDVALGSVGTRGRECKLEVPGSGGCRSMCCGRGFTTQTVEVRHRCECRYYWCCYVKCKTCTKKVQIHKCR